MGITPGGVVQRRIATTSTSAFIARKRRADWRRETWAKAKRESTVISFPSLRRMASTTFSVPKSLRRRCSGVRSATCPRKALRMALSLRRVSTAVTAWAKRWFSGAVPLLLVAFLTQISWLSGPRTSQTSRPPPLNLSVTMFFLSKRR